MNKTRNAEVGTRNRQLVLRPRTCCSALRVPHSAFFALGVLLPTTVPAQQWPVHSMDRPRPPVVDAGPERPAVAPPSDAIVLFDGKSLAEWQSENGTPAKWVVRDGSFEVAPHTGAIVTRRAFGDIQLHVAEAALRLDRPRVRRYLEEAVPHHPFRHTTILRLPLLQVLAVEQHYGIGGRRHRRPLGAGVDHRRTGALH